MSTGITITIPPEALAALREQLKGEILAELRDELRPEPEWMTAAECAEWLRYPVKRIRNLTAAGRMPHVRQDGRVLYNRLAIRVWLGEHRR